MQQYLLGIGIIAVLIWVVLTHQRPAPKVQGAEPIKVDTRWHFLRGSNDVAGSLSFSPSTDSTDPGELLQYQGRYYAPVGTAQNYKYTRDIYFVEPQLDVGAVGAYRSAARGSSAQTVSAALRVSPVRLLYGTVAPDAVISRDWVGGGFSLYPPESLVGPDWKHLGLGAYYTVPIRGPDYGGPGWAIGVSLSIR